MPDLNLIPKEIRAIAATGMRLVPVSGEKIPRIKEWPTQASRDLVQLGIWAEQFQSPRTNWAALTGPENGFWSLDTDDEAGAQWITQQIEFHGPEWIATRKVRTGRRTGGFHYHYQWPMNGTVLHSSSGKIAPGVDVKGWHGLAILPPSLHSSSGRRYAWETAINHEILPAPDWLIELVIAASNQSASPAKKNGDTKIPEGERNDSLYRMACSMRGRGMSEEAITAGLLAENAHACCPPLPESEVFRIASSAASHAPEPPEPRLILPGKEKNLRAVESLFETAAEFSAQAPSQTDYLVPPYIPAKSLVELLGKLKESGKTSFALLMVKALLDGGPFLERVCQRTPIVYLSEQSAASLRSSLAKAGLLNQQDLHLLRWHKAMGVEWIEIANASVEKAGQVGAKLLVVDTLGPFAGLVGDAENSSSVALEILRPLQAAQEKGIACLIVRHERKGETGIGDAGRGSSAYSGAMDAILRLSRLGINHPTNYRRLECVSRFEEGTGTVLLELTAEGYQLREKAAVTLQAAEQAVMDALPANEAESLTVRDLIGKTLHTRTTLDRVLAELMGRKLVKRLGAGLRGCAYRYYRAESESETCA